MKYYIDFDNTLFDTQLFNKDLLSLLSKYDIDENKIKDCHAKYFDNGLFNPLKVISKILEDDFNKEIVINEVNLFLQDLSKYVYSDSFEFLKYLKENKFDYSMLTYGDPEFQREKIKNSHINEYFETIIFCVNKKGELNLDYKNAIFIDDDVNQLKSILKQNAQVIRIRRLGNKHSVEDLENIIEFDNLLKCIEWLEKKDI